MTGDPVDNASVNRYIYGREVNGRGMADMDYFSICLNLFCLLVQGGLHLWFCSRLTGKKQGIWNGAGYLFILCILDWSANKFSLPWIAAIGAGLLLLYGVNRFALHNCPSASWAAAILASYISQFSFGLMNSVEAVLFPCVAGKPFLYLLVIAATGISFAVCMICYTIVVKSISPEEISRIENAVYLLFPVLFFFAAELYIMQTSYTQTFYSTTSAVLPLEDVGRHTALLVLQFLGLGALLCTLYAYRHLCHSLQAQAKMRSLTQAARAQKIYIAEAQTRYEQTRSFRHDMKNHLSVLNGLLNSEKLEEGKAYLKKLELASAMLSFPYQTGNPVVDILLGEKLEPAETEGIETEVSLLLPTPCGIDDFDLCVIFANALDNAICACRLLEGVKSIHISGERQGDFYMLIFENTCLDEPLPSPGIGLSNIKSVAEKYHGAMLTEKEGGHFSLNVLLNLSQLPKEERDRKWEKNCQKCL